MKPLIVANWKMNPATRKEAKRLFNFVKNGAKKIKNADIIICPPFLYISSFKPQISNLKLGAQDVFWEKEGAYTGQISASMLKDIDCRYVIIGHSERRKYFKETDEIINKKLKAFLEANLNPIFCIGETKEEREQGKTENILINQITSGLKGISLVNFSKVIIAYEPVWAIGTGNPCNIEEAQKMGLVIRRIISRIYSRNTSKNLSILYGGSVNSKNAAGYIKEAGLQGLLVGGASLKAKEFIEIIKAVS